MENQEHLISRKDKNLRMTGCRHLDFYLNSLQLCIWIIFWKPNIF